MSIKVNINLKLNFELQIDFQHCRCSDDMWYCICILIMQLMGDESASIGTGLQTAHLGRPDTFADWQRDPG